MKWKRIGEHLRDLELDQELLDDTKSTTHKVKHWQIRLYEN